MMRERWFWGTYKDVKAFGLLAAALAGALAGCSVLAPSVPLNAPPPRAQAELEVGERTVGAYVYAGIWNGLSGMDALERATGYRFGVTHWFTNWDAPWPARTVRQVVRRGSLPLITWQSHNRSFEDIAAGRYDRYLRSWARGVRAQRGEVYLRLFPEMNGDWTPWHGDPEGLVAAWRHIAELFRHEGAHNARFVWSPNATDAPRTEANRMEHYYPGEAYVDVLGLDGYNWGATQPWSAWRSFEDVFLAPYERLSRLGAQPVWFAEVASAEVGGDKAEWIRDMLASRAFPRLEAVIWFNENKETDWRIESSSASLAAFRDWFGGAP